jgi:hypothetical protein
VIAGHRAASRIVTEIATVNNIISSTISTGQDPLNVYEVEIWNEFVPYYIESVHLPTFATSLSSHQDHIKTYETKLIFFLK